MAKAPNLKDIPAGGAASATALNANNDAIQAAFENSLSRDGSAPNEMLTDLDMNGYNIINVGEITTSGSTDTLPTQAQLGEIFYPRTSKEVAAGVTPSYYHYEDLPVLDLRRYGLSTAASGATNRLAFEAAISIAKALGGAVLQAPPGSFTIDSTITIDGGSILIRGGGPRATIWVFDPGSPDVLFDFTAGASILYYSGIKDCSFYSTNSTTKTAVQAIDVNNFTFDNITIATGGWAGDSSIGLYVKGRDSANISHCTLNLARPVVFGVNPNYATLHVDHFRVEDCEFGTTLSTGKSIEVEDGVCFSNTTFNRIALTGGKYSFYWNDTSATASSFKLMFSNIRCEQNADGTGYWFYLNEAGSHYLQDVVFSNVYTGHSKNGYYLRRAQRVIFDNCTLVDAVITGKTQIDMDFTTISHLTLRNTLISASGLVTLQNHTLVREVPYNTGTHKISPSCEYVYYNLGRTAAEISASVVPTNIQYLPGDVRRYGAVGDNTTDCTTAINNAISAADVTALTGGALVTFPEGKFKITSSIILKMGVGVKGAGIGATTISYTGAAQAVKSTSPGTRIYNVGFSDLTLEDAGTGTIGFDLDSVSSSTFERLSISGFDTAVKLYSPTPGHSVYTRWFDVTANLCKVGWWLTGSSTNAHTWDSCRFNGASVSAKTITGATSASPIEFTSSSHGFATGDLVFFAALPGDFGTNLNNKVYAVTNTGTNTFTIAVDGSLYTAYTTGGTAKYMNIGWKLEDANGNHITKCHTDIVGIAHRITASTPGASDGNVIFGNRIESASVSTELGANVRHTYVSSNMHSSVTVAVIDNATNTVLYEPYYATPGFKMEFITPSSSSGHALFLRSVNGGTLSPLVRFVDSNTGSGTPVTVQAETERSTGTFFKGMRGGATYFEAFADGKVTATKFSGRHLTTVSADKGDTSPTLTVGTDSPIVRFATTLTANRTVTLSTTGAVDGDTFRVVRTGLGSFTLDVGGLKTIPSATAAFVDVAYNGSAWVLTGYGDL